MTNAVVRTTAALAAVALLCALPASAVAADRVVLGEYFTSLN